MFKRNKSWLFCLFFNTQGVYALLPETGHLPLTQLAFDDYQRCFPEQYISPLFIDRMLRANRSMDEGTQYLSKAEKKIKGAKKYFSVLNRIDDWHFYNPHKVSDELTVQGLVHKSMDRLWARGLSLFHSTKKSEDKALFLGALMHLLEDTSVPAHVMPVYHGPVAVKYMGHFEKYVDYMVAAGLVEGRGLKMMIKDAIDAQVIVPATLQKTSLNCNQIKAGALKTPDVLRYDMALYTLAKIKEVIPHCRDKDKNIQWQVFWNKPLKDQDGKLMKSDYFSAYNTQAGFPLFGKKGIIMDDEGNHYCAMNDNDERYLAFMEALQQEIRLQNIHLLRWAFSQIYP